MTRRSLQAYRVLVETPESDRIELLKGAISSLVINLGFLLIAKGDQRMILLLIFSTIAGLVLLLTPRGALGFGIIIGGLLADKIGYGPLVMAAFGFHILSAVVSLIVPATATTESAYQYLYWGSFIFAIANGTLEGVANPLVATLFPHNRTHYLNILHASWPAGLVAGTTLALIFGQGLHWGWKMQLGFFILPVVGYGLLFGLSQALSNMVNYMAMMSA